MAHEDTGASVAPAAAAPEVAAEEGLLPGVSAGPGLPMLTPAGPTKRGNFERMLEKRYGCFRLSEEESSLSAIIKMLTIELKNNASAGVTVSLVSVPLSISLAVAADATPIMGIATAAWAGFMSAIFGSSQYNILGPTGALSGILSTYSVRYGQNILPFLSILTGIILLIILLFRFDTYVMFMPQSVIQGFTVGVSIIIVLNQMAYAFGLPKLKRHEEFYANVIEAFKALDKTNPYALVTFILLFAALFTLGKKFGKIPWSIVVAIIGIAIGMSMSSGNSLGFKLDTLYDRFGDLNPSFWMGPTFPAGYFTLDVVAAAGSISFVALLETLISAKIASRMTKTSYNDAREVLGCALANIFSGAAGGIPATAALARTSLNIKSGGTSRMSAFVNATMVVVWSVLLLSFFKYLILPAVGAILVNVGVRMIEHHEIIHIYKHDKPQFVLFVVTTVIVVMVDPTNGLIVGAIFALLMFASVNSLAYGEMSVISTELSTFGQIILRRRPFEEFDTHYENNRVKEVEPAVGKSEYDGALIYRIPGDITYLNAPLHLKRAQQMAQGFQYILISVRYLYFYDNDGRDCLGEMVEAFGPKEKVVGEDGVAVTRETSKTIYLYGVSDAHMKHLSKYEWFLKMRQGKQCFKTYQGAVNSLKATLHGTEYEKPEQSGDDDH